MLFPSRSHSHAVSGTVVMLIIVRLLHHRRYGNNCPNNRNTVTLTVTVTIINGLVKLSAFDAHICPSKYLVSS